MAKLSEEVQTFIVQELACFRTPQEVADAVKDEFKVVVDRRQVQLYDAERAGKKPAEKWCVLFATTRAAFLDDRAAIAITHKNWRQRERLDMARSAKKQKNYKLAAEILDAAAKEEADFYARQGPANPAANTLTDEERAARIRAQLDAMDSVTVIEPEPAQAEADAPAFTVVAGTRPEAAA